GARGAVSDAAARRPPREAVATTATPSCLTGSAFLTSQTVWVLANQDPPTLRATALIRGATNVAHGFTLMLASLMSLAYLSISLRMNARNSSGVLATAITPSLAKPSFTSGSAASFTQSSCRRPTTRRGVAAGSGRPHQL